MPQGRSGDPSPLQAVRLAAGILAPRHFVGVLIEVLTADPMMDAKLGAPQPTKPALRFVGAGPVIGLELAGMIDPQHRIRGVQGIPRARLVGMNDRSAGDVLPDQRDRGTLARHDERKCATHDFAGDNDDLTLAGLFLGSAAVGSIRFAVRLFDLAAEIRAIDRNRAGQLRLIGAVNLGTHRLAQFVREHESCFVLTIEIAAQL
jgi:hypothetical protein